MRMLLPIIYVQFDLEWAHLEGYAITLKQSRVCSLAQQASGSEMIGLKSFVSQPNQLILSVVSIGIRLSPMFFPELCLIIGSEKLNYVREHCGCSMTLFSFPAKS